MKVLDFTLFKNYKDITTLKSIKPSKLSGPPYVVDIRQLQYTQNGEILYKFNYREESCWTSISESVTLKKELIDPIPLSKWNHLQELKITIDPRYHTFYDNLPHK